MDKKEQKNAIAKVKRAFKLRYLRPLTMNSVINKNGLLQICKYKAAPGLERVFCCTNHHNESVLQYRWRNDKKEWVIYDITHDGNSARNSTEVGICLIEVIDANVLTKEEFDELYTICRDRSKRNDKLYERIEKAMLKEITKNEESMEAWESISFGFDKRIGLSIWQGNLQPTKIKTGRTSQSIAMEEAIKQFIDKSE